MATCTKPSTYLNNRLLLEGTPLTIRAMQPTSVVSNNSSVSWALLFGPTVFVPNFVNATCKQVTEGSNTICVPDTPGSVEVIIQLGAAHLPVAALLALRGSTSTVYTQTSIFDGTTTTDGAVVTRSLATSGGLPTFYTSLSQPVIIPHVPGDDLTRVVTIRVMDKPTKAASNTWVEYSFTLYLDVAPCATSQNEEEPCSTPQIFINGIEITSSFPALSSAIDVVNVSTSATYSAGLNVFFQCGAFDPGLCQTRNGICVPVMDGNVTGSFFVTFGSSVASLGLLQFGTIVADVYDLFSPNTQSVLMTPGFGGYYPSQQTLVFQGPMGAADSKGSLIVFTITNRSTGEVYTAQLFLVAQRLPC